MRDVAVMISTVILLVITHPLYQLHSAEAGSHVRPLIEQAIRNGDSAADRNDFPAALLAYDSAYALAYTSDRDNMNPTIHHKIGRILGLTGYRNPLKLDRAAEIFGPQHCLRFHPQDRVCQEGYAAALLRQPELMKVAQGLEQLAKLKERTGDDKQEQALLLFAFGLGTMKAQGRGGIPDLGTRQDWKRDFQALSDGTYPHTAAPSFLSLVNLFELTRDDPEWKEPTCTVRADKQAILDEAGDWLGASPIEERVKLTALARIQECKGQMKSALSRYRQALFTSSRFFEEDLRGWAKDQHPSLMSFIQVAEEAWDQFLDKLNGQAIMRLYERQIDSGQVLRTGSPSLRDIRVYPQELLGTTPVRPLTGPNDALVPLVIVGEAFDPLWLREVRIRVTPVGKGGKANSVSVDPLWELNKNQNAFHVRRFVLRLALPPTNSSYEIEIEAVSIFCRKDPCPQETVDRKVLTTAPITSRNVTASKPPKAILIGIGKYERLQGLEYPTNDVRMLFRLLTNPLRKQGREYIDYQDIVKLLDEKADYRNIRELLASLSTVNNNRQVFLDQMVMLYFSGHGYRESMAQLKLWVDDIEVTRERGCLLLYDASTKTCASGSITARDLADYLSKITVRALLTIIDSCHSGDARALGEDIWVYTPQRNQAGGAMMISSTAMDFESIEMGSSEHGLFTAYLLEGLRGKADRPDNNGSRDGKVTLLELWHYLQSELPTVRWVRGNSEPTPFQIPTFTSREWKEPVTLVDNSELVRLESKLNEALTSRPLTTAEFKGALTILRYDPDPDTWQEILDQGLLIEFIEGRIPHFSDLLPMLSRGQRLLVSAGR